jgi:hypothetical protein
MQGPEKHTPIAAKGKLEATVSVLTKVFVVLATVLAVLLVPLMIAYVNNTAHFKSDLDTANAVRSVAESRAAAAETALARVQEGQASALSALNAEKAQLLARIETIRTDLNAAQVAQINAENKLATKDAQISQLSAGYDQAQTINASQAKQIDELQTKTLKTETRFVEVSNDLQEKITTLATLTEQVRLIQEQLKDAQDQLANQQKQQVVAMVGSSATATAAPLPPAGVNIRGQITAVDSVGDQTFVAVNVGRQDNVAEGMHFIIHSGDQYLGSLTITKVDLNSSAGRITLKRGDIVKDLDIMASSF